MIKCHEQTISVQTYIHSHPVNKWGNVQTGWNRTSIYNLVQLCTTMYNHVQPIKILYKLVTTLHPCTTMYRLLQPLRTFYNHVQPCTIGHCENHIFYLRKTLPR